MLDWIALFYCYNRSTIVSFALVSFVKILESMMSFYKIITIIYLFFYLLIQFSHGIFLFIFLSFFYFFIFQYFDIWFKILILTWYYLYLFIFFQYFDIWFFKNKFLKGVLDSEERTILVNWYNSLISKSFSWNVENDLCGYYSGVICDSSSPQRVIQLYYLFGNNAY